MYKLLLEKKVEKELEAIPTKFLRNIDEKILFLSQNPRPHGCKKLAGVDGYRIRAGGYRILYTVNDKTKTIRIYRIKSRKEAYR